MCFSMPSYEKVKKKTKCIYAIIFFTINLFNKLYSINNLHLLLVSLKCLMETILQACAKPPVKFILSPKGLCLVNFSKKVHYKLNNYFTIYVASLFMNISRLITVALMWEFCVLTSYSQNLKTACLPQLI